jgi:hypothetical protein
VSSGFHLPYGARRPAQAAGRAQQSRTVERLARAGYAAKGVIFGLVGLLALRVALDGGGSAPGQKGAVATVAGQPFGKALLAALAIGLFGYTLWNVVVAVAGPRGEDGGKGAAKRAGAAVKAVIYGGLLVYAVSILFRAGSSGGGGNPDHVTAKVLSWPGGTWVVGAVGVAIIAVAVYNLYQAISRSFMKDFPEGRMSPGVRRAAARVGRAGLTARAVVFALIGVFVIKAAMDYNPKATVGLGGALDKLARQSYGSWLLGIVAAGLLCYGVYCLFAARYARIDD